MDDYKNRMKEYIKNFVRKELAISDDSDIENQSQLSEKAKRDYKDEYKKFQSSTKAKKYRAELNKYNRKKGTYGNGDGKDASHKGGKIVGFESQSKNRGRAEKSRLKKEDVSEVKASARMSDIMSKLAKSLGVKSVVSMHTGSGSLSYFVDDKMEAKKLENMLKKTFKRVRLIPLDKSKGDTANFVVAADMLGLESVNESEQDKIKQYLMKKGDNEKDATEKLRYYDMVTKMYKKANSIKKAEIMSSLWANESVNEGQKREASNIQKKYDKAHLKFAREVRDIIKMINKYQGDRTDGKIIDKAYSKHLIPFNQLIQSWTDGQHGNPNLTEGVSKSQAQEIMRQLGGRKFEMLMGVKSKGIGKDGLILHIGRNPKKVSHIIIDLSRDEYNLTFGKIYKYQFKVLKKLKGVGVEQLHDMIEKYTGLYTTFGSRK